MNPPRGPVGTTPRRSQGEESQESRQPREGQADPFAPQDPETQAVLVTYCRRACEGRPREPKPGPRTEGENALKGEPQEGHDGPRPQGCGRRTYPRRDRRPEVDRVRTLPRGARRIDASNATRAGGSERGPDRRGESALKREADGRCGTARAARNGGGRREGGTQTPDAARSGAGSPAECGSAVSHVSYGSKAHGRKHRPACRLRSAGRCGSAAMDL